jgi:sugar/nucleoside kinase (ribokinase family)
MMTPKPFDLLVAGEINPDLILTGNVEPAFGQAEKLVTSADLAVGSSSAIFACGAARLGLKVAFAGVCGDDFFGRFMLAEMTKRGIDISHTVVDPALQTGLSVILNRGSDRAILTHPGCIAALPAEQVTDDLLEQSLHLHVASYFLQTALQPGLPDLFTRAHTLGLTTSLDPNWDPSGEWRSLDTLLRSVDVFLPNVVEAQALSGATTVEAALDDLGRICSTVAIKLGEKGAIAVRAGRHARAPAPAVAVVDTVGAGDSFDAGFLYGWLKGWSLEETLRLGAACGSLSTRAAGGTAAQPSLDEANGYVGRPPG